VLELGSLHKLTHDCLDWRGRKGVMRGGRGV
jgi:hypothetical protein